MSKRRGWGRVRQLPSKRYQASYLGPDLGVHKAAGTYASKIDAEGWLATERRLVDAGTWTPPHVRNRPDERNGTFEDYATTWLQLRVSSEQIRPRTAALYRSILAHHLLPTFGRHPLTAITPQDVKRWYAGLGPTPTARANAYGLLRTVLGEAVSDELIPTNPVRIKGAGSKKRERELRVLTVEQFQTIVDEVPPRYTALILVTGWCALRFGEMAALRRSDVDLEAGELHIRRAVVTLKGQTLVGPPKSDAGRRSVSIPPHIVPALRRHLLEHAAPGADGLVFPAADRSSFLALSTLHRVYRPAKEKAGRPDVRVHDLRHFGGIMAARSGATLGELQQRLGHSTAQAAMIYQSSISERHTQIADRLSELAGVSLK